MQGTREAWLTQAATLLNGIILEAGTTPAESVRVSCGWPARGALSRGKRRIGECWPGENNADQHSHVFVSPVLDKPVQVLETLLHELIHAALPAKVKHNKRFAKVAHATGLVGKPTATVAGDALVARLHEQVTPALGPYPHQSIDATTKLKQTTRMRLYECQCDPVQAKAEGRTAKVRAATDKLDATCNVCESAFTLQGAGDGE